MSHITHHAQKRLRARGISRDAVELVLTYGRLFHVRGAQIYVIGRKELKRHPHLNPGLEGIHAVCSPDGAVVLTVYRNHDFRGLRREGFHYSPPEANHDPNPINSDYRPVA